MTAAGAGAPFARLSLSLLLALGAALALQALRAPLPWMIGPLVCTAVLTMVGAPLAASRRLRDAGQFVLGLSLGLYFTPQVLRLLVGHAGVVGLGIAWALALGLLFGRFLRRANAGIDAPTAYFASAIGGASEMAVLAERHDARVDLVAAAHSTRLLIVVLAVPFGFQWLGMQGADPTTPGVQAVSWPGLAALAAAGLVGAAVLLRSAQPNPWFLGPLFAAILLTANEVALSAMPRGLSNAAQLVIGVMLGSRFTPAFVHTAPRWLASVAVGTVVMIAACAGFGLAVAAWTGLHPGTVMLGTAPGGIAEMCITAKVLQMGVPVVTAFHVSRLVAVLLLAAPLYRWSSNARRRSPRS